MKKYTDEELKNALGKMGSFIFDADTNVEELNDAQRTLLGVLGELGSEEDTMTMLLKSLALMSIFAEEKGYRFFSIDEDTKHDKYYELKMLISASSMPGIINAVMSVDNAFDYLSFLFNEYGSMFSEEEMMIPLLYGLRTNAHIYDKICEVFGIETEISDETIYYIGDQINEQIPEITHESNHEIMSELRKMEKLMEEMHKDTNRSIERTFVLQKQANGLLNKIADGIASLESRIIRIKKVWWNK